MLLAFCLLFYSFSSSQLVWAETTTSPDIVVTEDDVVLENSSCPAGQDSSYIMGHPDGSAIIGFGKCVNTFAVTLAINEALTASGVSIDAINYSWRYANGCFNTSGGSAQYDQWCKDNIEDRVDTTTGEVLDGEYADQFDILTVKVIVTDANGDIIEERTYTYDTWFDFENSNSYSDEEYYEEDMGFYWQVQRDSIRFWNGMTGEGTIYSPDQLGNITFRAQSVDGAYWEGGAYGPLVTAGTLNFTYRPNPCANNTLFDPSCPGYAEAYAQQEYNNNCQTDPLYDPGCDGYHAAYEQQQYNNACYNDPLYDAGCPGYSEAYAQQQFKLQCSLDALYDPLCSGYAEALAEQQSQQQLEETIEDPVINMITTDPIEIITVQEPVVEPIVVEQPVIEVTFDETIDEPQVTTETVVEDIIEEIELEDPVVEESPVEEPVVEEVVEEETTEETTEEVTNEEIRQSETSEEDGETSQENVESTSGEEEQESGETEAEDNPQDTGTQARQLTPAQKKAAKEKKIKELIVQRLKNLAKEMGEAKSLEAQRDTQNYIIALLGFKVGFDAYRTEIPENYYYDDRDINGDKKVPENNRGLRNGLAQEILHEKMVDEQYKDMD